MSRAALLYYRKRLYDDGAIAELKLWRVPRTVPGSTHPFKYSLYYGRHGKRLIGYDNEAGKGDHRHYEDIEGSLSLHDTGTVDEGFSDRCASPARSLKETTP